MRFWRRGGLDSVPPEAGGRARRGGRAALFAVPIVASVVVALAASGVMNTLAQYTASIINTDNAVQSATAGLTEGENGTDCSAPGDGQWHDCPAINKFGGGTLSSGGQASHTVSLTNTGNTTAALSLLPSACSDDLTGANGALCSLVTVAVSCDNGASIAALTLNDFFTGRNFPTGYSMGTIAAGATIDCTFTLTAGSIPAGGGSISQPIAWKLTA